MHATASPSRSSLTLPGCTVVDPKLRNAPAALCIRARAATSLRAWKLCKAYGKLEPVLAFAPDFFLPTHCDLCFHGFHRPNHVHCYWRRRTGPVSGLVRDKLKPYLHACAAALCSTAFVAPTQTKSLRASRAVEDRVAKTLTE
eukprot:s10826_g1.t1